MSDHPTHSGHVPPIRQRKPGELLWTPLTGHKTEAVYRRYAITSEADLREGVARLNGSGSDKGGRRTA